MIFRFAGVTRSEAAGLLGSRTGGETMVAHPPSGFAHVPSGHAG
jgi:hypothetical protein